MPVIRFTTYIEAPIEQCFDTAIDVDVHAASMANTKERAVSGVTTGKLKLGDTVTWEAVHLGVKQRLTSHITQYSRPVFFEDRMVKGAFHSFTHMHRFRVQGSGTLMLDVFNYKSPLGPLGSLADKLFLERYMRNFLKQHANYVKHAAEQKAAS